MSELLFGTALVLILLATAGFIIYIVRQEKIAFTWAYRILLLGFIFHTVFLCYAYYHLGTAPVISFKSALSFFAWCITGVYLLFQLRFGLMVLGSFVAPLAAVMMIISVAVPGADAAASPMLRSLWLTVHVLTIFIGDAMFAITFAAAIMYLLQERQIKSKKRGTFYSRLPSLETLDSINYQSLVYGFPFLTFGMITGAMYAHFALGSFWRWDPKEVWTLITWLSYAVLLHQRITVGWRGKRAAIMSIICFLLLVFTFIGGSVWLSDYHSFRNLNSLEGV